MKVSRIVLLALVFSLVAALAVVTVAWNAAREQVGYAVARLGNALERELAEKPIDTNSDPAYERLALEVPGADWKAVDANSFIVSYPPRLGAVAAGSTPGLVDIPGFLYLEASGDTCLKTLEVATGRMDSALGASMLHYYERDGGDSQPAAAGSRQGCIANFDGSQSIYFSYPASREKDALTSLESLRMVVSPWTAGTVRP